MAPELPFVSPDEKQVCLWCFQDLFGDDHNKNGFKMFDSSDYHGQDLLFKDATIRVVPVGEKTTYHDWLGLDYVAALEGMLSQHCSGAGRAVVPLDGLVHTHSQRRSGCPAIFPCIIVGLSPQTLG